MATDPRGVETSSADRPLRDQLVLRFPLLIDLAAKAVRKLPPGTRLRRRLIKRTFEIVWEAINRGDFAPALLAYESDAEVQIVGASGVGLAGSYSGRSGWTDFIDDIFENFGASHFTVRRVKDGGDRVVAELVLTATGKVSGAQVVETTTSVYYLSPRGKVVRQTVYWQQDSWNTALDAAGLLP